MVRDGVGMRLSGFATNQHTPRPSRWLEQRLSWMRMLTHCYSTGSMYYSCQTVAKMANHCLPNSPGKSLV